MRDRGRRQGCAEDVCLAGSDGVEIRADRDGRCDAFRRWLRTCIKTASGALMFALTALKIDIGVPRGERSDTFDSHFGKDRAMLGRDRCGGIRRREFLGAGTAAVASSLPFVETLRGRCRAQSGGRSPGPRRQAKWSWACLDPTRAGSSKSATRAWFATAEEP